MGTGKLLISPRPIVYSIVVRRLFIVLIVIVVVLIIAAASVGLYIRQYQHLDVDVDSAKSNFSVEIGDVYELTLVLRLTNDGSVDLYVPPTTFDLYVDGVKAGPGEAEKVTVPAGSMAWTTAIVEISQAHAPLAYIALVDPGEDKITMIGEAHVEVGPFMLDYPFEESFMMNV
jgi:LEA14-like dessication related protein